MKYRSMESFLSKRKSSLRTVTRGATTYRPLSSVFIGSKDRMETVIIPQKPEKEKAETVRLG